MLANQYARRYAEAQVNSLDRHRLLLLVFDGGQRFLTGAREALAGGDIGRFCEQMSRAQAVIGELTSTLDHKAGGEIAAQLSRLYDFMLLHLTEANLQRSVRHVDDVIRVYGIISGAYRDILGQPGTEASAA